MPDQTTDDPTVTCPCCGHTFTPPPARKGRPPGPHRRELEALKVGGKPARFPNEVRRAIVNLVSKMNATGPGHYVVSAERGKTVVRRTS